MINMRKFFFLLAMFWAVYAAANPLLLCGRKSSGEDLTTGLVLHLEFENNVLDSSLEGNDGTASGSPTYTTEFAGLGQAINMDGVDDVVTITQDASINNLNTITLAAFAHLDDFGEGNLGRIWYKNGSGEGFDTFFRITNGDLTFSYARWSGVSGRWRFPTSSFTTGTDYCIVITYDAGSTSNDARLYLNGVEQTPVSVVSPTGSLNNDVSDLLIGDVTASTRAFDGRFDDIRVLNVIWTPDQVNAYCNLAGLGT